MRTCVYIDAFNLYYGAVRKTHLKWLNIEKLCDYLLPDSDIVSIKYFTALISLQPDNPRRPDRQESYLRALGTLPTVKIIYGIFRTREVYMPRVPVSGGSVEFVKVFKTEEKGSDVNLGAHLVHDAHRGIFEGAVVVSNDSDLHEPIRIVSRELGKPVGVINPHKKNSSVLSKHASFTKKIRSGVLMDSQFPDVLSDAQGEFRKPESW